MQDIVIKVLTDAAFRDALLANPEQTLLSTGVAPDPEILDTLRQASPEALRALAETFAMDGDATCTCTCTCTC